MSACPDNLFVARPVGKAEIERTLAAKEAVRKAWIRLRSKYVWDEDNPREWDEVRAEARKVGCIVHLGYIFGLCVEMNSKLSVELRKYKGRVVFQGIKCTTKNITALLSRTWAALPLLCRRLRPSISLDACQAALLRSPMPNKHIYKQT